MADSIRQIGLLQPINVRRAGEGGYELIAGERRLRACKLAGLTEIKAIVLDSAYDRDIAMIAMIENLQRENLHFFEEAACQLPQPRGAKIQAMAFPTAASRD